MKIIELRSKSQEELVDLVKQSRKELMNLRFQQASRELKNTARFNVVKKTIARIYTILKQQKIGVKHG